MKTTLIALLALVGALVLATSPASAADKVPQAKRVAGEKLDSGLGDLPHYRTWSDPSGKNPQQFAGEKLDSGLGDLPPYRLWADPSGKTPVDAALVAAGSQPPK